jgi:guanylate kinase
MTKGILIVISAPSGCGKTTIAKAILRKHPDMLFSVSATTRPIRDGEVNGKDYFFLSKQEFEERIHSGDLVEWEEIFGNYYGTLKSEVQRALEHNRVMLFDIDVKGALSIKQNFPDASVLVFIKPPSFEVLKKRLESRKTEGAAALKTRLDRVPMELGKENEFQFKVINDDLQKAIDEVDNIILKNIKSKIQS